MDGVGVGGGSASDDGVAAVLALAAAVPFFVGRYKVVRSVYFTFRDQAKIIIIRTLRSFPVSFLPLGAGLFAC